MKDIKIDKRWVDFAETLERVEYEGQEIFHIGTLTDWLRYITVTKRILQEDEPTDDELRDAKGYWEHLQEENKTRNIDTYLYYNDKGLTILFKNI